MDRAEVAFKSLILMNNFYCYNDSLDRRDSVPAFSEASSFSNRATLKKLLRFDYLNIFRDYSRRRASHTIQYFEL